MTLTGRKCRTSISLVQVPLYPRQISHSPGCNPFQEQVWYSHASSNRTATRKVLEKSLENNM